MPEYRREAVDLYELLEVSPRASQDVIQAAYRTLARTYHPDLNANPDAGARIRQLNGAYGVLSDPLNRARYDLDRTRARRHEWVVNQQHPHARTAPLRQRHGRRQAAHPATTVGRPMEDCFPLLNSQVMLGLILVATLAAMTLVLIWSTLDSTADSARTYGGTDVELTGR